MKILMRGYADATRSLGATEALHSPERLIGQNTGNLVFTAAVHRTLLTEGTTLEVGTHTMFESDPEEINERYDHVVVPLANAFRRGFSNPLARLTELIRGLSIPVTILGVGAQASLDYDASGLAPMEDAIKAFVSAALDHGPSIGVRGEFTAEYLRGLGFSDVVTIGCPSMFYHGRALSVGSGPERFDATTRIALSLTPRVATPKGWVREHVARHPDTIYVGQDSADLAMMLGGPALTSGDGDYPGHLAHPVLAADRMRVFLHAPTWIDAVRDREFSFGSRIHGNIAPILAGVPAHVIVHDSRTRELAEHFQIPHTLSRDITSASTAEALFAASDWTAMVSGHRERFERFSAFLADHRLEHVHDRSSGEVPFDRAVRHGGVGTEAALRVWSSEPGTLSERAWQAASVAHSAPAVTAEVERLHQDVAAVTAQNRALAAEIAGQASPAARSILRAAARRRRARRAASPSA